MPERNATPPWVVAAAAVAGFFAFSGSGKPRLARARHVDPGSDGVPRSPAITHPAAVPQDGAGRDAEHPHHIPAKGWWMVLKRAVGEAGEDRLLAEAAGVTFYTLLALFPAIAALVSIYGLVSDPATVRDHVESLAGIIPGGGMQIIEEQLQRVTSKGEGTLGLSALLGLAVSLWSSNQATKAVFDALNVIYEEKERRGFIRLTLTSLAFTLGGLVFAVVAMGAIVVLPVVFNTVGLGSTVEWILRVARWPLLLLVVATILAALYRFGPSRDRARWRWVSWGSAVATIIWLAGSLGFSWYVESFGSYDETYGSLGAVIGFMTWIWISAAVVLFGAEINAELEHQTARDTTTGPERPMGARGARMADTVAPG